MILSNDDMMILSTLNVSLNGRVRNKPVMDHTSCDIGGSHDFVDYQPFTAGENIRHIDWNRYANDASLFTRQYEKLERPEISVVIDQSRSIVSGGKADSVKYLSAAICFCLLNNGMTVKLFSDNLLHRYSGQAGFKRICHDIEKLPNGHRILSLKQISQSISDNAIVISDFVFSEGFQQFKSNINIGIRSALLINLSNQFDRSPDLEGNLRLEDSQTGRHLPCYVDSSMIERYKKCRTDYYHQIQKHCMKINWQFKDINIEDALPLQLQMLAPSGKLYV